MADSVAEPSPATSHANPSPRLAGRAWTLSWTPPALGLLAASGAAVIASEERLVAAWGSARRLGAATSRPFDAAAALEVLAGLEIEDCGGAQDARALLYGALAFDPAVPGDLVLPALSVSVPRSGGLSTWVAVSAQDGPADAAAHLPRAEAWLPSEVAAALGLALPDDNRAADPPLGPDSFDLRSQRSHEEFRLLVQEALERIGRGEANKIVLARAVEVEANRQFLIEEVVDRLAALYPACTLYFVDGFLGATPELLVSRHGRSVSSRPLAGTVGHSGDPVADRAAETSLMKSAKNRREHRLVVEHVQEGLGRTCEAVEVPEEPEVLRLRNVSHLCTVLRGRLGPEQGSRGCALALAFSLHPTPAVAGVPTKAALEFISEREKLDRGPYAGPVGWMDSSGDGEWWVGIRCAQVQGRRARLYAGVGIVSGSDPHCELTETQLKLQALLAALVRP